MFLPDRRPCLAYCACVPEPQLDVCVNLHACPSHSYTSVSTGTPMLLATLDKFDAPSPALTPGYRYCDIWVLPQIRIHNHRVGALAGHTSPRRSGVRANQRLSLHDRRHVTRSVRNARRKPRRAHGQRRQGAIGVRRERSEWPQRCVIRQPQLTQRCQWGMLPRRSRPSANGRSPQGNCSLLMALWPVT